MSTHTRDDHHHPVDADVPLGYYEVMETAVRELLIGKKLIGPEEIRRQIEVSDSTAMVRYLVLPLRPEGTEAYTEAQLAALVTRDTMIGVVRATIPRPQRTSL
jgi:hypothetical protein